MMDRLHLPATGESYWNQNKKYLENRIVIVADTIAIEKGRGIIEFPGNVMVNGEYLCEWHYSEKKWQMVNELTRIVPPSEMMSTGINP